jgi:hypothetical protein
MSYVPVRLMSRCVLQAGAFYGPVRLIGRASYGPVRLIGRYVLCAGASYVSVRLTGRGVLWTCATYRPCFLWTGASYRPGNAVYAL